MTQKRKQAKQDEPRKVTIGGCLYYIFSNGAIEDEEGNPLDW